MNRSEGSQVPQSPDWALDRVGSFRVPFSQLDFVVRTVESVEVDISGCGSLIPCGAGQSTTHGNLAAPAPFYLMFSRESRAWPPAAPEIHWCGLTARCARVTDSLILTLQQLLTLRLADDRPERRTRHHPLDFLLHYRCTIGSLGFPGLGCNDPSRQAHARLHE